MIYLDNSATTRPYDEVLDYMKVVGGEYFGNPSSLHKKGLEAERLVKKSRQAIAKTLGCDEKEVYFTSGGSEANNFAIFGYLEANPRKGKHIITSKIEHPSVLECVKQLSKKGYKVDMVGVNENGTIDIKELTELINEDTSLVSIMLVNNETGALQPVDEIDSIIKKNSSLAVLHVDAVQGFGKIAITPKKMGIGMLTISSHKIHGPKGVGALYVDSSVRIAPFIYGGGQESKLRSGTENVPGISGFGLAAELTASNMNEYFQKVTGLRDLFIERLNEIDRCSIILKDAVPYILSVSFEGVRAEVLLHCLEERDIFVSTGSACSSKKNVHSHVLKAMGLKPSEIEGAVRFSFSSFNTESDIDETISAIKDSLRLFRHR
ncbi:MAG TPA: cysteine desulfurase family protein [Clostridia bacterium]